MPDTTIEKFDIKKFFSGFINPTTWSKTVVYLIIGTVIVGGLIFVKGLFSKDKPIVNNPRAVGIGKLEKDAINQSSTNIVYEREKDWEVGLGAGGITYDNKTGGVVGGWVRKKF